MNLSANRIHMLFESFFDLFKTASCLIYPSMPCETVSKTTKFLSKILSIRIANRFMKMWIGLFLFCSSLAADEEYQFRGVHFVASYSQCDAGALGDPDTLEMVMREAAIASGATILNVASHRFPPDGLTCVILLSESHASIHTYPEHGACFVDLFTCGNRCSYLKFDQVLQNYLKPNLVESRVLHRHEGIDDLSQ